MDELPLEQLWYLFYTQFHKNRMSSLDVLKKFYAREESVKGRKDEPTVENKRKYHLLTAMCMGPAKKEFQTAVKVQKQAELMFGNFMHVEAKYPERIYFSRPYRIRAREELEAQQKAYEATVSVFQSDPGGETSTPTQRAALADKSTVSKSRAYLLDAQNFFYAIIGSHEPDFDFEQTSRKTLLEYVLEFRTNLENSLFLPTLELELIVEYVRGENDLRLLELLKNGIREQNLSGNFSEDEASQTIFDCLKDYLAEERAFFLLSICDDPEKESPYFFHLLIASDSTRCLCLSQNAGKEYAIEKPVSEIYKNLNGETVKLVELTKIDFEDSKTETIDLLEGLAVDKKFVEIEASFYFEETFVSNIITTLLRSPYGHRLPIHDMLARLNARNPEWQSMLATVPTTTVKDMDTDGTETPRKAAPIVDEDGPKFDSIYLLKREFAEAGFLMEIL